MTSVSRRYYVGAMFQPIWSPFADETADFAQVLGFGLGLVNGESIYKVRNMPIAGFTTCRIETDAQELLLGDGCPAESFLECSETFGFDKAGEREARVMREMGQPRIFCSADVARWPAQADRQAYARKAQGSVIIPERRKICAGAENAFLRKSETWPKVRAC